MTVSNTPPEGLVEHVKTLAAEDDDLTSEQVNRVIVAYQSVYDGEPVGTVRVDRTTGAVAQRDVIDGVHKWRVLTPGADPHFDTRPSLPDWDLVIQGE